MVRQQQLLSNLVGAPNCCCRTIVLDLCVAQIENNGPAAAVIVESGGGAFFSQTSPIQFYADIA
jgi:hypothetical protein